MSSIETLVDEVARATGLGSNSRTFIGVVANYIFKQPGGISGMVNKFEHAGLGDIAKSWLSGSPNMRSIDPNQIRSALGNQDLQELGEKSGVGSKMIAPLLATVLPMLFRTITSGGAMPTTLPAGLAGLMSGGARSRKKPFRVWRWLLPLLALLALAYCGWQSRHLAKAPPVAAPTGNLAATATRPTLSFKNAGGKVDLKGTVATVAEKASLLGAAAGAFGQKNVTADIGVNPGLPATAWLDSLKAMLAAPSLKADGLKFDFNGDALTLDTSALPMDQRAELSQLFQSRLGNVQIDGLYDKGIAALDSLKPGYGATELAKALNDTSLTFDNNSAQLTASSLSTIDKAATAILGAPASMKVEITGHTDNTGNASLNQTLSEQRAQAVSAALVKKGVPASQLVARGVGADQPIADNSTEAGRAQNRRIAYTAY
ncbi:OmpA family protein [Stenotrophomonas sp. NPDC077464]|uniref:OmpA family protein n=1 Tax=unclassified Stenotrophomonas TaxID=196198 RepID=UPI0037D19C34